MLEACGFSVLAHVVIVVILVHFWSVGVMCSVGVWTTPVVSVLVGVVFVVSVIRCVISLGLVAPPLLWRELPNGLCYWFIVFCYLNY